jgi:hypothetical protein
MADSIFHVSTDVGNPACSIDTNGAPVLIVSSNNIVSSTGIAVSASFATLAATASKATLAVTASYATFAATASGTYS